MPPDEGGTNRLAGEAGTLVRLMTQRKRKKGNGGRGGDRTRTFSILSRMPLLIGLRDRRWKLVLPARLTSLCSV